MEWYTKAANQGDVDALCNLGRCYYEGLGVQQNYYKAVEWFNKAANQGHAGAQCYLGYCYHYGKGVQKNESLAKTWIKDAASKDFDEAIEFCRKMGW